MSEWCVTRQGHVAPHQGRMAPGSKHAAHLMLSPTSISSISPLAGLSAHQYVRMSPHTCIQPSDFSLVLEAYTPLCDDAYRNGPRSVAFRKHKYDPGTLQAVPTPSLIYRSPTLSPSFDIFNEYSQEEQVCAPWDPRYDSIATRVGRPFSHPKHTSSIEQEVD